MENNVIEQDKYVYAFEINDSFWFGICEKSEIESILEKSNYKVAFYEQAPRIVPSNIKDRIKYKDLCYFNFASIISIYGLSKIDFDDEIFLKLKEEFCDNLSYAEFVTNTIKDFLIGYCTAEDGFDEPKRDVGFIISDLITFYNHIANYAKNELKRRIININSLNGSIDAITKFIGISTTDQ